MNRIALLSAFAALALAGCSSTCQRLADIDYSAKQGTCDKSKVSATTKTDEAKCEAGYSKCSDADKTKLDEYATCAEGITNCEAGKEIEWAGQLITCAGKLQGVSAECSAGLSGG